MSECVVACTVPGDDETLRWLDGAHWHHGSWAAFSAALRGRRWALLVDGRETTQLLLELPVRDLATARRAAPFAVEEHVAQPIDQAHIAVAARGDDHYAIAVADGARIAALRERITTLGLYPASVVPDSCALPYSGDGIHVAAVDDGWLLRYAGGGLRIDDAALAEVLAQLRRELPETRTVTIYRDAAAADRAFDSELFAGFDLQHGASAHSEAWFRNATAAGAPAFFDASVRAHDARRARRLWVVAAAALLLVVIAYPAFLALANQRLTAEISRVENANRELVRAAFPAITRIVNPRVQAEQAVAQLRARAASGPRFLDLMADVESVLGRDTGDASVIRSITFSGSALELGIRAADMSDLDVLRERFGDAGLAIRVVSAEAVDDGVSARLLLSRRNANGTVREHATAPPGAPAEDRS